MGKKVSQYLRELADREAIRECINAFSRGIDRMDRELLESCFWPGAQDDHAGIYKGTATGLIDLAMGHLVSITSTSHFLGNVMIEIDGDNARAESYVFACHQLLGDEQPSNFIVSARYVDKFEKRNDEWRISDRVLLNDWFLKVPADGEWVRGLWDLTINGTRKPADRSYEIINSLRGRK